MKKIVLLIIILILLAGCNRTSEVDTLIIYCSIDEIWAAPLFDQFRQQTGIQVKPIYDSEANKSVGLANRLIAEKSAPIADLYWSGEPLQIQRLAVAEVLQPYKTAGIKLPEYYKSWHNPLWIPNSFRQRVFVINTNQYEDAQNFPANIATLTNQLYRGKIAMAKPQFGSTLYHFNELFTQMGPKKFNQFLLNIKANKVKIFAGNSQVALQTKSGNSSIGLTDNDDATRENAKGAPFIIKGCGLYFASGLGVIARQNINQKNIQAFIDFVISDQVQKSLHEKAPYNYMVKDILANNLCQDNAQALVDNMPTLMQTLRKAGF